jgi:TPR repeat protein
MKKNDVKLAWSLYLQQNYDAAFKILFRLAKSGDIKAQRIIGDAYLSGKGVDLDPTKAIFWFKKGIKQKDGVSAYQLGLIYHPASVGCETVKKSLKLSNQYFELAVDFFKDKIKENDCEAMHWLGLCYQLGQGVSQDFNKSIYWLEQAFDRGYLFSANDLFSYYSQEDKGWFDACKARKFYQVLKESGEQVIFNEKYK